MRIDLHTHSDFSDGTVAPAGLVRQAAETGLDVVALTDHDCFAGWDAATAAAAEAGIDLVRGIEISCTFAGAGVHLLGYLPDPGEPALLAELERILDGRNDRLPGTLAKLHDLGIELTEEQVRAVAGPASALGRPHVADALIAQGVVADRDEAFARFLGPGGPAYVDRYAADVETMIRLVDGAGGVGVLAHPWAGRHDASALDVEGFERLRAAGLAGVEVDHQDHDAETRARLRDLARGLDLVVTGSSDFHGTGKVGFDLGCNTTDPGEYERLLGLAADAANRAGRGSEVVSR